MEMRHQMTRKVLEQLNGSGIRTNHLFHNFDLVGIADALDDPPFGLIHRLSVFVFNIFAFWIFGRYSIALQNCSAMRRLIFFLTDLIFSFKAQLTGTMGESFCSFLPSSIHALPQTPNS
ncbi:hypothetical protein H5410_026419 [Solanum commersonii]|uniref:Uncharacterized protein n=1 Tax=Solanum commersonii TaxID=4109 RepID=A0A9J5YYY8_SOLCO|nr:hypothetical protein H5410_026419 [Solanum commersonii]